MLRDPHTQRDPPQNTEMTTNIIETCHTHSQQQKHQKIPERHLGKEHRHAQDPELTQTPRSRWAPNLLHGA